MNYQKYCKPQQVQYALAARRGRSAEVGRGARTLRRGSAVTARGAAQPLWPLRGVPKQAGSTSSPAQCAALRRAARWPALEVALVRADARAALRQRDCAFLSEGGVPGNPWPREPRRRASVRRAAFACSRARRGASWPMASPGQARANKERQAQGRGGWKSRGQGGEQGRPSPRDFGRRGKGGAQGRLPLRLGCGGKGEGGRASARGQGRLRRLGP